MTRVLVWKELREQGTILAALIVLGCAVLIAASIALETNDAGRATELRSLGYAGRLALLMLTLTAGVVVGGALFAGEREAGTFVYLDQLPVSRWSVWWRKMVTGAALVAVATMVMQIVAFAGGILPSRESNNVILGWVLLISTIAYSAYAWGVFGSVLSRTSLGACGTGLAVGTVMGCVLYAGLALGLRMAQSRYNIRPFVGEHTALVLAFQIASYAMIVVPLPVAAWIYTAPDRARKLAELQVRVPGVAGSVRSGLRFVSGHGWGASTRRMLWLTLRQLRGTTLALVATALVVGIVFIPLESIPVVVWPGVALLAGVLIGVVGVADEQNSAAFRFWGERRMPVGRLWLAKVLGGLGMLGLVLLALVIPALIAAFLRENSRGPFFATVFRTGLFAEEGFPVLAYLLVWPVYGFVCGHLSSLLFRKTIVAAAVAIMTGAIFAAVWLPSFLAGGLRGWQVFVPALGLVLTTRFLMWAWATDRLGTRRALTRLAVGAGLVFAFIGGSLVYRVAEVPLVADVEDDRRFAASLPSFDDQQAGRDLRRAVAQFALVDDETRRMQPDRLSGLAADPSVLKKRAEVIATLDKGWPSTKPDFDRYLDDVFVSGWNKSMALVVDKPVGVVEDPNELDFDTLLRNTHPVRIMADLLLVQALREQHRGNPTAIPDAVQTSLAAIRTARNKTLIWPVSSSFAMEHSVFRAIDRWLENLAQHPDLLCLVLADVSQHDRLDSYDPQAIVFAHQVVARNLIHGPSRALPKYLDAMRPGVAWRDNLLGTTSPAADVESNLISFAWTVPWEQERLRRVIGMGNTPGRWKAEAKFLAGAPGWHHIGGPPERAMEQVEGQHQLLVTVRRATMLKLAIRLFEAETGTLPVKLADLVPEYLPSVPADPYDGQPFRYRVSVGEAIELEPDTQPDPVPQSGPGLYPFLTHRQYLAFAGLGGCVVCWPLDSAWQELDLSTPQGALSADGPAPLRVTGPSGGAPGAEPPDGPAAPATGGPGGPGRVELQITIPAGQGILWSVGPDRQNNGGRYGLSIRQFTGNQTGDLIFPIPRPEKKP